MKAREVARFSVVLAVLLLSGCFGLFEAPAAEAPGVEPKVAASGGVEPFSGLAPPVEDLGPRIPVSVWVEERWLKPLQPTVAFLDAPAGARVRWYVGIEGAHPEVRFVNGRPHLTVEGKAAERPASSGEIAPGASAGLRLGELGRHAFALKGAPEAGLVATVAPDAQDEARVVVFLVRDESGSRFLPPRVSLRPGAVLVFLNQAQEPMQADRVGFQPWVGTEPQALHLVGVDEGLYSVIAEVADETGAHGEASERFLVDFDKPATREERSFGGRFTGVAPAGTLGSENDSMRMDSPYPVARARIAANASSQLTPGGSVRVALDANGARVAEAVVGEEGALLLVEDLPPGEYVVLVLPESGAMVRYEVAMRLEYRLPLPEALGGTG